MSELSEAIRINDQERFDKLIKNNYDLNIKDYYGRTALMNAIMYGKKEFATKLIDAGCDLNIISRAENAAIHFDETHFDDIKLKLIEAGCDLNIKNGYGNTILMEACKKNLPNLITKLIEVGCNLDIKNESNKIYKAYVTKSMEPIIEKALKLRNRYIKLLKICIRYIKRNRKFFEERDINRLNRDLRGFFIF